MRWMTLRTGASRRLASVFALLVAGCSHETVSPGVLHLLPEGVEEQPLIVGRVSRMGFVSASGERRLIRFTVPNGNPKLWLACASSPTSSGGPGDVVAFRARLTSAGAEARPVLDETAGPGTLPSPICADPVPHGRAITAGGAHVHPA
jgi:hypothetical protein